METNNINQELVKKYIDNELSSNEKKQFEDRKKNDPEFARYLEERLKMRKNIKEHFKNEELRSQIQTIMDAETPKQNEEENKPSKAKIVTLKRTTIIFAVAANVLLLVGLFFISFDQDIARGESESFKDKVEFAKELNKIGNKHQENEKYVLAIDYYTHAIDYTKKDELKANYYYAIAECYYKLENYELAEEKLKIAIEKEYPATETTLKLKFPKLYENK